MEPVTASRDPIGPGRVSRIIESFVVRSYRIDVRVFTPIRIGRCLVICVYPTRSLSSRRLQSVNDIASKARAVRVRNGGRRESPVRVAHRLRIVRRFRGPPSAGHNTHHVIVVRWKNNVQ